MKKSYVGVLAGLVVILCATYVGICFVKGDLGFLSALTLNSRSKIAAPHVVEAHMPTAQELFELIASLNNQIDSAALGKMNQQHPTASRTGGSSSQSPHTDVETSSDEGNTTENAGALVVSAVNAAAANTQSIDGSKTASGANASNLKLLLVQRKHLMISLAKESPAFFLASILSQDAKSKIPQVLQSEIEQPFTTTGIVTLIQTDDFKNPEKSYLEILLASKEGNIPLYATTNLNLESGETYKIKGVKLGSIVVVDTAEFVADTQPIVTPTSSLGDKVLVLPINFDDSAPLSVTRENLNQRIFNGPFKNFYTEQSYGTKNFVGDVLNWTTLPGECRLPHFTPLDQEIVDIITSNHVDLSQYGYIVMVMNGDCIIDRSTIGKTIVEIEGHPYKVSVATVQTNTRTFNEQEWGESGRPQPFDWTEFDGSLSHEIGHGLGLNHARSWLCANSVLYGDCEYDEYGNLFDVMGFRLDALHLNAVYKDLLQWLPSNNVLDIRTSGRYTLNVFEDSVSSTTKKIAKVNVRGSVVPPFYLEFRKGFGFDSKLNIPELVANQSGLLINRSLTPNGAGKYKNSRLLDIDPRFGVGDDRWALMGSQVLSDSGRGITVGPIVSVSSTAIVFDVQIQNPVCLRNDPLVQFFGLSQDSILIGTSGTVLVRFGNGDSFSCEKSKFTVTTDIPELWYPNIRPLGDPVLQPTDEQLIGQQKTIDFFVPLDTVPGTEFDFHVTVKNTSTGHDVIKNLHVIALAQPSILDIQPPSGSIGTHVTLTGSNFSSESYLYVTGEQGWFFIQPSDLVVTPTTIEFDVPPQIYSNDCPGGTCPLIDTLTGWYQLVVEAYGFQSNPVFFEITS